MLRYLVDPIFQVINTAGKPATGGYIEVYLHGTRDKYYCASDFDGTLHPFRIPLDSLGSNIILADDGNAYDIYVYNRYGSLLMSRYNVTPLSIDDIAESLAQKKDRQDAVAFNGSPTKTVKSISQNANGVMSVEFEDIDLPQEVPNVDIVSPNNTITVTATTDPQTNTKTFEIDVEANDGASCGWFNSSNIDTVGNEESINVDRFRVSEGQTVIGNGLEFVPNSGDVESDVPFGKVYANAGIYFVSVRVNLSWTGNPVNKICNVAGRQFDFSYNHGERVSMTNLMRFSSRTKMSISISLESDIPAGLRIWVERFQIFAINAGTLKIQGIEAVEHDGTLTGNGTNANPLSIQSALDVSNANTAPEYDQTATYPTVGTLRYHENVLYKSTVAINTAEAWNPAHWTTTSVDEQIGNVEALLAAL
jgi:hypothetical protein